MRQVFKGVARIAAIAALTVSGGALVAVPPAVADIGADIGLVCSGKAGTHEVALRIDATVPSSGTVGQPIQLGTIKIDVALPPGLVKEVGASSPGGASTPPVTGVTPSSAPTPTLGGVAEIKVAVRAPRGDQRGGWPAFALAAAPPRGDGAVHLTGSGVAPPVVPRSPGGHSWSARELGLSLVPGDTTAGKDTAELALHCVAEKEKVLETVQVGRGGDASTPGALSAPTRQAATAQENLCEELPYPGTDPRYAINYEDSKMKALYESPETPDVRDSPGSGFAYCAKAAGFANIKKTGNAVPIALENSIQLPASTHVGNIFTGPNWNEYRGYAVSKTYQTPATLLGFGFMPTRAVAEAVQVGAPGSGETGPITGNLRVIQAIGADSATPGAPSRWQLGARAYIRLKAGQAEVNGVPLDLGDECMTSPTLFSAVGSLGTQRAGTSPYLEGQTIIAEDLEVPAFSGCGVGEDLSPILTAAVSGSGNYANVEAGRYCSVRAQLGCVDGAGPPPETFTIKPGGEVTAVAKPFILNRSTTPSGGQFRCDSATVRFQTDSAHWQSRFRLAKGDMSLEGCEVQASDGKVYELAERGEVTQEGSLWLNIITRREDGLLDARINGVMLNAPMDFNGTRCTLRIANTLTHVIGLLPPVEAPGEIIGTYDNGTNGNKTKVFSMATSPTSPSSTALEVTPESTCNIPGFTSHASRFQSGTADFVFPPTFELTSP